MFWVKHSEDEIMAKWLKDSLSDECPECHSPIENGYNENMECTRRRCVNKACPRMLASRVAFMCKTLEIAGIKEGVSYKLIKEHGLTNYFDAIPLICKEKPQILLPTLIKFAFIFGLSDEATDICKDYSTVNEVIDNYVGKYKAELSSKREMLKYGEQFFEIVKPYQVEKEFSPLVGGCVVITGEIPGFDNRNDFIPIVNNMFLGLTNFTYSTSRRKTGLFCCIAQDKSATTGKVQEAKSAGVPIYTKDEFMQVIINKIKDAGLYDNYVKAFKERSNP